jgi:hypothetical protein
VRKPQAVFAKAVFVSKNNQTIYQDRLGTTEIGKVEKEEAFFS